MKVFISWSGDRSKRIADILRRWIPGVLQAVKPYFSPADVVKGSRWTIEISKELEASRVGLLIVTQDNVSAPWLLFEAGALAKNLHESKVCPLLFGIEPTDITGPLVQFQASRFDEPEMKRVIGMINSELGESALPPEVLDSVFGMWWPQLELEIKEEIGRPRISGEGLRSERELLEEVLSLTRSFVREASLRPLSQTSFKEEWRRTKGLVEITGVTPRDLISMGIAGELVTVDVLTPLDQVAQLMIRNDYSQISITKDSRLVGSLNEAALFHQLQRDPAMKSKSVESVMQPPFPFVDVSTPIELLSTMITPENPAVLVRTLRLTRRI